MVLGPDTDCWAVIYNGEGESHSVCFTDPALRGQLWKLQEDHDWDDFQYVSLGAEDTYAYSVDGRVHTKVRVEDLKDELHDAKTSGKKVLVSTLKLLCSYH